MLEEKTTDALIIGAGISGLACAAWLRQQGLSVAVLETAPQAGGVMQTELHNGYLCETGPNSLLETSPRIAELIALADLQDDMIAAGPQAKRRYIVKNARLQALPMSPLAFLRTPLFSPAAKLRLMREPFIAPLPAAEDESIASFVRRRLGNEFLDYAIDPFVAGVYAGDPDNLSVACAFPKLKALEANYGSLIRGAIRGREERAQREDKAKDRARMLSFRRGLGQLNTALAQKLGRNILYEISNLQIARDPIEANWQVSFRQRSESYSLTAQHLVLTIPTNRLLEIFSGELAEACRPLQQIPYAPVVVLTTGFKQENVQHPLDGFGFLAPKKEKRQILGTLWNSSIFPERAPAGRVLLTTFIGGARQPQLADLNDEKLIELTLKELRDLIGAHGRPEFMHVRRYARAIPQYALGHQRYQQIIDRLERDFPGLHIAANYRDGVSVSDCIVRAHRTAGEIAQVHAHLKKHEALAFV